MSISKMEKRTFLNANGSKYQILAQCGDIYLVKDIDWENFIVVTNICKVKTELDSTTNEEVNIYSWSSGEYFNKRFNNAVCYFFNKSLKEFDFLNNEDENQKEASEFLEKIKEEFSEWYEN